MKVVVTGAAGMIGANLLRGLNAIGVDDIVAVDDLHDGAKYVNLAGAKISDYFDRRDFYDRFARGELGRFDVVFHEGACSDTMEHDGRLMPSTRPMSRSAAFAAIVPKVAIWLTASRPYFALT